MNDILARILDYNRYATVSTCSSDGSPYATPLHVAYDAAYLYWLSPAAAVHSQNIARDGRVFVTLFDSHQTVEQPTDRAAIYLQSVAEQLAGDAAQAARAVYTARFGAGRPGNEELPIYRAPLGKIDQQKSDAGRLYLRTDNEEVTA